MDTEEKEQENQRLTKKLKDLNEKVYELSEYYSDRGQHNAQSYLVTASEILETLIELYETDDDYLNR